MDIQTINQDATLSVRYKAHRPIGSGGHADIFLAEQLNVGRQVALKIMKPSLFTGDPDKAQEMSERFKQEARFISKLKDSHTITLYDFGITPQGKHFMAFEYIEGESLKALLQREGVLSAKRTVTIMRQVLMSLQEAHAYGMIHRDIKPDNILIYELLGRTDRVKVLDFGIAKLADQEEDLTQTGNFIGTPRYAAPERIRGQKLQPSSDLYSLGLVAYQMLTGQRPFEGMGAVQVIQEQALGPALQLPEHLSISPALREIVNRMLLKDSAARYPVAEAILNDLESWSEPTVKANGHHQPFTEERIDERPEHAAATNKYPKTVPKTAPATVRMDPIVASTFLKQDKAHSDEVAIDRASTIEFQRPVETIQAIDEQIERQRAAKSEPQLSDKKKERQQAYKQHRQVTPSLLGDRPDHLPTTPHQPNHVAQRTDNKNLLHTTMTGNPQRAPRASSPAQKSKSSAGLIIGVVMMILFSLGVLGAVIKIFVFP